MAERQAPTRWLLRPRPSPRARVRLFCFPYAGGAAHIFHTWAGGLPDACELNAVQFPGRGSRLREEPFRSLTELVRATADALLPYLGQPFALFGHSIGAIIGFELARHLRREHSLEPIHLFVSGSDAPQTRETGEATYALPEEEFLAEISRLKGTPKEALEHPELMRLALPALRADFEVLQTYVYSREPPLGCSITAYGGLQDEEVSRDNLEGWCEQTTAHFSMRMFPGDHFFLHAAQPLLLKAIAAELARLIE